jgi:hypothetical protein
MKEQDVRQETWRPNGPFNRRLEPILWWGILDRRGPIPAYSCRFRQLGSQFAGMIVAGIRVNVTSGQHGAAARRSSRLPFLKEFVMPRRDEAVAVT